MTVLTSQNIPSNLLAHYLTGQATAKEIAARLLVAPATVIKRLRAMGVDTAKGRYKTRQLAFEIERDQQKPMGTADATVASLYQSGLSTYEVAARLGCARQRAWRLLQRHGVTLRPRWYREVFRTTDGRPRSMRRFSAKVLEMRRERRWSQDYVGRLCGVSGKCIGYWERGVQGPSWRVLRRLARVFNVSLAELGITWEPLV